MVNHTGANDLLDACVFNAGFSYGESESTVAIAVFDEGFFPQSPLDWIYDIDHQSYISFTVRVQGNENLLLRLNHWMQSRTIFTIPASFGSFSNEQKIMFFQFLTGMVVVKLH